MALHNISETIASHSTDVKRSISKERLIKTDLQNRLGIIFL